MAQNYTFERYRPDGDDEYIASKDLAIAVNTALAADQPLIVAGEPGTGKTSLADSVAKQLKWGKALKFATKSEHQGRDCLYTFDSMRRFYDAQVEDARAKDPKNYVEYQALGEALRSPSTRVVLIDEIDKAPRDFPNDLLDALDGDMQFTVRETGEVIAAHHRPFVIITTNGERQLPDAFLRRCVFHQIAFPDAHDLQRIVEAYLRKHMGIAPEEIEQGFIKTVVRRFDKLRELPLEKKPATGELVSWVRVLLRAGVTESALSDGPISLFNPGVLLKLETDIKALLAAERAKPSSAFTERTRP